MYEQILGDLTMIKVDTVEISGAEIVTRTLKTGKENVKLKNTFIRLIDVAVDSAASKDKKQAGFCKNKSFFICRENIVEGGKRPLTTTFLIAIQINTAEKLCLCKKFSILIKLNAQRNAFVKKLSPTQDDRFDFSFNSIAIYDLNMP